MLNPVMNVVDHSHTGFAITTKDMTTKKYIMREINIEKEQNHLLENYS